MLKFIQSRSCEFVALVFALSLVVACGGDTEGDGGAPRSPVGQELGSIAQLADGVIGANAEAYEGVEFAAAALEGAFGASAAVVMKQESCIPAEYQNTTLGYDPPSGTYTSTAIPGAPEGGVSVLIYEIEAGTPTTNNIGRLDVTCSGFLPNPALVATLYVNEVDVLKLNATVNLGVDYYYMDVSGFLKSADGVQQINYGEQYGSGGGRTGSDSTFGVTFTVGEQTYATLTRNISPNLDEQGVYVSVYKEGMEFYYEFQFLADLWGTLEGVSGHGTFENVVGGGAIDIVACFEGTFENMDVTAASECFPDPDLEFLDLVTLPPSDLQAIEDAYHGLRRMYAAVEGVSTAAAAIGMAALADMNQ